MKTLTRSKLGSFNPADLLRYGFAYLEWQAKSDDTKIAEFQDAAKFEQDVVRGSALWEHGMNVIEAPTGEGIEYFIDPGFWIQYQAAVEELNDWLQRAKPVLQSLHQGLEELVRMAIADGEAPTDAWERLNAEAQRRGLNAVPLIPLLIGAAVAVLVFIIIGYFGPSWIRAWADADVIRQEGAARVQAFMNVEALRLEGYRQLNAARAQQGLAPVNVPFVDLPQNDNGRGNNGAGKFTAGTIVGLLLGAGAVYVGVKALGGGGGGGK